MYQGWTLLMELDGLNDHAAVRKYTWGLDLSGTLSGAGGIGGLLGVHDSTVPEFGDYIYFADANGNVGQVVDWASGEIVARYEYDAYGDMLVADGSYALTNPFRFSTKYWDDESGLGYWGYRYYTPWLGRWMSRDPKGEKGGWNLYAYVGNDAPNKRDSLGLAGESNGGCGGVCGPDITDALLTMVNEIDTAFSAMPASEKDDVCSGFIGATNWDTHLFWKPYRFESTNCPKGDKCGFDNAVPGAKGGASVTVAGRCYASYDVNYLLYGRAIKNCGGWTVLSGNFWFVAYKNPISSDSTWTRYVQAKNWIEESVNFGDVLPLPILSPENLRDCKPCGEKWTENIGWRLMKKSGAFYVGPGGF